jgi:hypothetical protein
MLGAMARQHTSFASLLGHLVGMDDDHPSTTYFPSLEVPLSCTVGRRTGRPSRVIDLDCNDEATSIVCGGF